MAPPVGGPEGGACVDGAAVDGAEEVSEELVGAGVVLAGPGHELQGVVAEEEVGGAEEDENRYHPVPVTEPHLALFEVRDYQGRFFTNLRKLR